MDLKNKKVLVTFGPTWVSIDDVRILSNRSSGEMGRRIIEKLLASGAQVTALEGPVFLPLKKRDHLTIKKFFFYDEFKLLFLEELKRGYDIVVHAAAVSDFKPMKKFHGKIKSDKKATLVLLPTSKLIQKVKAVAPKTVLIGFKLEPSRSQTTLKKEAMKSILNNNCDYVVANSISKGYTGFILNQEGTTLAGVKSKNGMASALLKVLTNHFKKNDTSRN
ncbi:MAG: phosphopantothenoylcysteine decarboxylase [Candidatus Omnitrophota bacterium]